MRLLEILITMDVPFKRLEDRDFKWLIRNLWIKNSDHPDFGEAVKLLSDILESKGILGYDVLTDQPEDEQP
ncbi:MAG: hypothetical protein CMG78_12135 [Marinobacter sp.]|nr:hypothetical protein [Marinobacter sp.]